MTHCGKCGITLGRWHGERAGLVSGEPNDHAGKQRFPSQP
jgi:hypothetical protein